MKSSRQGLAGLWRNSNRARDNLPTGRSSGEPPWTRNRRRFWRRYWVLERGTRFELATTCLEGRGSAGLSYPRVAPLRTRIAHWKYAGWAARGSIAARG